MKNILLSYGLLFLSLFSFQEIFAQSSEEPMTREEINALIQRHFSNEGTVFNWNTTNARTIWSAALRSDSMLSIGFKPAYIDAYTFKSQIGKYDFSAPEWDNIRQDIVESTLDDIAARNPNTRLGRDYLMPFGEKKPLPYLMIRVIDLETVELLMARTDIRFVEPMGYSLADEREKSGAGCSNTPDAINPADLVSISGTCNSVRSWHHTAHNVECAWNNGWAGQGMEVAVLDSGVSDDQSQFTMPDFAECESAGRSFNKTGFYTDAPSGSDDCGHGTAMSGLLAAPWGDDGTPVGVAYKANFNSFRVAENVLLDTSDETNAAANAFIAAANDPNIKITSMSLGWVFSSGVIETAIQYAYSQDLMMFCAAGTTTDGLSDITNALVGVIFPADMPETVACTGVTDAAIGSRDRCSACHSGEEVDFVAVMEREVDEGRDAVSLIMTDLQIGYVGGSSASTATIAGLAAIIWGANPTESREQIYNRMAKSGDYYPNRNSEYGWGVVDVCQAADPSFLPPCDPTYSNSNVEITITDIVFPSTDDNFNDAEWVIEIAGQEYLFVITEDGGSGAPSLFHDNDGCGSMPMTINLGNTACGQNAITVNVTTHEDDGGGTDCDYNGGFPAFDDDFSSQNVTIDFTSGTFTHSGATGNFVFTFTTSCQPISTPSAVVSSTRRVCQGDTPPDVLFNFAGGTAPYTATYNINGGSTQTITTTGTNTSVAIPVSTATAGVFTYTITQVDDQLGCHIEDSAYTIDVLSNCVLEVFPKVYLQGPLDMSGALPLMGDALRTGVLLPSLDPYFGTHTAGATAFDSRANDTVIDWVVVEIRDAITNTAILASIPALVQRDGDVVSHTDGFSPVQFPYSSSGDFNIAIRHRNHLGVMTSTPVSLFPSQF